MDDKSQSKSTSNNNKDAVTKVHDVAEQARSAAIERVDLVREQADSAKAKAAESVRKLGRAVHKIGEHMRIEDQRYIAERAQGASQRLESAASYIDDTDLSTLIRDVESVTRQNTAWVVGGTFLLGLAAGRILKVPGNGTRPQLQAATDTGFGEPSERESDRRPARVPSASAPREDARR